VTYLGRIGLAALMAAGLAGEAGCYGYVAPPRGASLAGREAQLRLSDSGAVVMASAIGPAAESVVGRVVSDTGTTVVVALAQVRRRDGDEVDWRGERIAISRTLITGTGTRRFSPSRTALFSGIIGAALIAARQAFQGLGTGGGGGGVGQSGHR
jgi:hypothetical protein